jgi:asparagine N-glycosylation enzyme membrane subunit Stt3
LSVVISNLHLFTFTFLAGFWFIWKQRQNKAIVLFTVWTLVMLAMAMNERRFLYYLTLNIGILSAFCIFELAAKLKGKVLQNAVILSLPLIIVSLPLAKGVTATTPYLMTQEWHDSLVWLKEQPDEGKISCWGDYGHWVVYVAEKTPNYLPGPGGDTLAKAYLSQTDDEAQKYLEQLDTSFLVVDEFMVRRKYQALQIYSGMDTPPVQSMAYRLYYSSACPDYLVLAYQEAGIKIFRYKG